MEREHRDEALTQEGNFGKGQLYIITYIEALNWGLIVTLNWKQFSKVFSSNNVRPRVFVILVLYAYCIIPSLLLLIYK